MSPRMNTTPTTSCRSLPVVVLALLASAAAVSAHDDQVVETRTLRETLTITDRSETPTVVVDNVFGSILVVGHRGSTVEMVARETVRARSRTALGNARDEVELSIVSEGSEVVLYVDGPFRDDRGRCCSNWRDRGYTVVYDFELRVPANADLELRTINEGQVEVRGVHGRFEVSNVNGGIEMEGVGGSGKATTVNGPVRIRFDESPEQDSAFHTVNGRVDITFPSGLSADLGFKTWNGDVYTDFEAEPLPVRPARKERSDGSWVLKTDEWTRVRVAAGGPELTFETLNGNITIRRDR
jgi:hypothetical protein